MCGINGFNFEDPRLVEAMNERTKHRGPDQTATYVSDGISLGFNRLAIIDVSERGSQPMWDAQKEVCIIFNGEIYNFQALRTFLAKKYTFVSTSDTEVILYAYKEYGTDCLSKLNGMFSLAIWDTRTKELHVARDPAGIKPLYYYYDGQKFIFSSEIKAILAHDIDRTIDRTAFNLYFSLLYVPAPYTMFQSVRKLLPGHGITIKDNNLKIWNFEFAAPETGYTSRQDAQKKIRSLFDDSIRRQLVSDRPVGVFLSGGIDSTAVLGAVAAQKTGIIKTFSVTYTDSAESEKFNADAVLARRTATYYHTDHHELSMGVEDFAHELETIAWHLDEPNANATAGAMLLLSRYARQSVTVVLGGDGGDELFGGYPRYYMSALASNYAKLPKFAQKMALLGLSVLGMKDKAHQLAVPPGSARITGFLAQKQPLLKTFLSKDIFQPGVAEQYFEHQFFAKNPPSTWSKDFEQTFMNVDRQSWLVDESLLRTDKMTMAAGIEARVPILDLPLTQLAARLPTSYKFRLLGNTPAQFLGKDIWRAAVADYLPSFVVKQKKRGWFTPTAKWLRHPTLLSRVREILSPQNLPPGYFNADQVNKMLEEHVAGKVYNANAIWAIVMWCLWYRAFAQKK